MGYYSDVALCRIKTGGVFKTICWTWVCAADCAWGSGIGLFAKVCHSRDNFWRNGEL